MSDEYLRPLADALEQHFRLSHNTKGLTMYQEKALIKAAVTSAAATTGGWLLTEAVFGFWGLVLAVPVTIASGAWLAHRARRIAT